MPIALQNMLNPFYVERQLTKGEKRAFPGKRTRKGSPCNHYINARNIPSASPPTPVKLIRAVLEAADFDRW